MSSDRQQVVGILRLVRSAGSGTWAAERALRDQVRQVGVPAVRSVGKAMQRGWLLFGDGEPPALTLDGLREAARPTASSRGGAATARRGPPAAGLAAAG